MTYEQYNVYIDKLAKTPKQDFHEEMQANVDEVFYMSSDWYTIEEEDSFGSDTYSEIDVRINSVVNTTTGTNRGDDWRKIIFKDIDKVVQVGQFYQFADNYWVVISTDVILGVTNTCTTRRCNNTLRWISDTTGAKFSIPCVLDYSIQENRDYASSTSAVVNPSGILEVISQLNLDTNLIKSTQRFLFGNSSNWNSYKVFGGGINNFANVETTDNASTGLLKLTLGYIQYNSDGDDLVNGYADNSELLYTIELDKSSISGIATDTYQLSAEVFLTGDSVSRTVNWVSDDTDIATVSSGLVTFVATGTATITASLDGDTSIYDACGVTVNATPISEYSVVVNPETNFLLESETETYAVVLELNGAVQADVFTFAVTSSGVPTDNYTFTTIDGNSFSIKNIEKYMNEPLVVKATSGVYTKDIDILLRGAW